MYVLIKEERLNNNYNIYSIGEFENSKEAEEALKQEKNKLQEEGFYSFNLRKKRGRIVYAALTKNKRASKKRGDVVILSVKKIPSYPIDYREYAQSSDLLGGLRLRGGKGFAENANSLALSFRLLADEKDFLKKQANKLGISISDLIRFALFQYFKKGGKNEKNWWNFKIAYW